MRLVVDTGVLWKRHIIDLLAEMGDAVIIPAIVFTERARQVARHGWTAAEFESRLNQWGFTIEPYGVAEACRFAVHQSDDAVWVKHARDAMIAGHVREGDQLWTTNPTDFITLGVPPGQILVVGG